MRLSFSNIGWDASDDERMYRSLAARGFSAVEIAPGRFTGERPYDRADEARKKAADLEREHGLAVCSMQSIWYGRSETICGSPEERKALADYTLRALDYALAAGCPNLVFGCPKNRSARAPGDGETLLAFFKEICSAAADRGLRIAIEANPPIYGTNFLNDTASACAFARRVGRGAAVNLDFGTMLANAENIAAVSNDLDVISHVHISEPGLRPIERREEHRELARALREGGYAGFVSAEMRCRPAGEALAAADWLAEVFA